MNRIVTKDYVYESGIEHVSTDVKEADENG
jgi:hypothetical protein